jgi:hypothetical protein
VKKMGAGTNQQREVYPSRSSPWMPAVLAYHHKELEALANLWRKPAILAYHHRELAILTNLWSEGT